MSPDTVPFETEEPYMRLSIYDQVFPISILPFILTDVKRKDLFVSGYSVSLRRTGYTEIYAKMYVYYR